MALTLDNIPVSFKDELLSEIERESALARVVPTTRVEMGDNLLTFSLGLEPASMVSGTNYSNLPGEGEVKPVGENGGMVNARAYKFTQIILVSDEYMRKLPRLYDEILRQAPSTIARGVDVEALASSESHEGFAGFGVPGNPYAAGVNGDTAYEAIVNAFSAVATASGRRPNAIIGSAAFGVDVMTATANDGRPVFGTGADGVGRVFGARLVESDAFAYGPSGTAPAAVVGDFDRARLGLVDDVRLKILEEATIQVAPEQFVSLAQQNMIGVLVEGWAAFMAEPGAFATIGAPGNIPELPIG